MKQLKQIYTICKKSQISEQKYINSQHGDTERTYIYRYIKYIHKADFLKKQNKILSFVKNYLSSVHV